LQGGLGTVREDVIKVMLAVLLMPPLLHTLLLRSATASLLGVHREGLEHEAVCLYKKVSYCRSLTQQLAPKHQTAAHPSPSPSAAWGGETDKRGNSRVEIKTV